MNLLSLVIGRIESDEEDDLSDFIDDGPEEEEDYSKHIREIFGYDKRRLVFLICQIVI